MKRFKTPSSKNNSTKVIKMQDEKIHKAGISEYFTQIKTTGNPVQTCLCSFYSVVCLTVWHVYNDIHV